MSGIVPIDDVKAAAGIEDSRSDLWFAGAISSVTDAIEIVTGHWFVARGSATYYFDAPYVDDELRVPQGVASVTYLGIASSDQPDDGTGTYTTIASGYYLDPPAQVRRNGEPATRITLGRTAAARFPTCGEKRAVKVTATAWGWSAVPPRVGQIAIAAITRAFRAKASGQADLAIVGPDGGMKILRDFAPSELDELRESFSEVHVG